MHDIFAIERRVLKINARFVPQSYGIVRLLIDVVNGVRSVVNVFRDEHELEFVRFVEDFFDVGVAQMLKDLPNNQQLSVGQRFIVGGVHANKSFVYGFKSFRVIFYQRFDNVNARIKIVELVLVKKFKHSTHNPKVSATDVDDIANVVVR